jgi:hypothetical protein
MVSRPTCTGRPAGAKRPFHQGGIEIISWHKMSPATVICARKNRSLYPGPKDALGTAMVKSRVDARTIARGVALALMCRLLGCGGAIGGAHSDASASKDGGVGLDGAACAIQASNYDQSCSTDSDCVAVAGNLAVQFGNYCEEQCLCGGDAINRTAVTKYIADVSGTPFGSGTLPLDGGCNCGHFSGPCCQAGKCAAGQICQSVPDAGSADVTYAPPSGSVLCALRAGPVDAGAADAGPVSWCIPPQFCAMYNGGWACCMTVGFGSLCFPIDAGGRD